MLMRKLGRTGLKVAAFCLGGNTFGWTTDQAASEAVLDAFMEAGGNFVDTADVYSRCAPGNVGGESETCSASGWRRAATATRSSCATKVCGAMGDGPNDRGLSRQHIMHGGRGVAAAAADRLHRPLPGPLGRPDTPLDETLRAFDDLVRQGKVRYIGCSNYRSWRLTRGAGGSEPARPAHATSRCSRSTTSCSATSTSASSSRSAASRRSA